MKKDVLKKKYPDGGNVQDNTFIKKPIDKTQFKQELTNEELEALAHQFRGEGSGYSGNRYHSTYVKKAGAIMNESGNLTDSQMNELGKYMDRASFLQKLYEGLPNLGRMLGDGYSAADLPKNSKLRKYKDGGKIDLSDTSTNRQVLSLEEFKNIVPDYQYNGYLNSGIDGKYKNFDKTKYPVLIDKLKDGTITYRPYTTENSEKTDETFNDVSRFQEGGIVQSWIQKFVTGGKIYAQGGANPYITPNPYIDSYAGMKEFNPYAETGMQGMGYQKLNTNPIDYTQSLNNIQPIQFNNQMQVPVVQSSMQPYNTPYQTNYDASNDQVNKDNSQADFMMGKTSKTPVSADTVLGKINMVGDLANGALTAFAKPGSKASAYAQGATKAQSVVKPLEKIPILGQASKLISGIIGGALEARRQGIEDEEQKKQFKMTEYLDRNLVTAKTPSYYGQYHAKYGANPKIMEQRIIDDIYSDFDKYMKKV